jgi:hypothetical protein
MRRFAPADSIVLRDVWRERPWVAMGAVVVEDGEELIALYIPGGAPLDFAPVAPIPHPWSGRDAWEGHGVLMLNRPGERYGVWVFWEGAERDFSRWYVNLQAPLSRSRIGFDMHDHELDLWSSDGATWQWKDDELLDQRVAEGLFTADEALAIRAEGKRVHDELRAQGMWWSLAWADWSPDLSWRAPTLPPGWERL